MLYKARLMASMFHAGQLRKYTYESYIVHPREVAEILTTVPHTVEMLAAAWLHDVVEDTECTLADIDTVIGSKEVTYLVRMLTDSSSHADGNRAYRKAKYCEQLYHASDAAKTIKLADVISNISSIVKYDPDFAVVYMREKEALLEVLHGGDKTLFDRVYKLIQEYKSK